MEILTNILVPLGLFVITIGLALVSCSVIWWAFRSIWHWNMDRLTQRTAEERVRAREAMKAARRANRG